MRIDSSGRVGIGTSTPSESLSIAGNIELTLGGNRFINLGSSTNYNYLLQAVNDDFQIIEAGITPRLVIKYPDGKIGISTTNPQALTHISFSPPATVPALGSGAGALALGPAANYGMLLGTLSDGSGYIQQQRFDNTTTVYPIALQPNGGNVGIGTTTPTQKLQVESSALFQAIFKGTDAGGGGGIRTYNSGGTAGVALLTYGPSYAGGSIGSVGTNGSAVVQTGDAPMFVGTDAGISQPVYFGTNGLERMRIDSTGNVGIGASSPGAKLDVRGNLNVIGASGVASTSLIGAILGTSNGYEIIQSAADALTYNWRKGDNTIAMTLDSIGNLLLKASSDGTNGIIRIQNTAGTTTVQSYADNNDGWLGTVEAKRLSFITGNTRRMCIDSSGNVGVGTDAPSGYGKLAVIGGNFGVSQDSVTVTTIRGNANIGNIGAFNSTGASLTFSTAPSGSGEVERARIDSSGNLLVGATSIPTTTGWTAQMYNGGSYTRTAHNTNAVSGDAFSQFYYNSASIGSIDQNGTTGVLYTTASDGRLKHDIIDAPEASSLIDAIQVRSFKWNADNSEQRYGMIAQELQEVVPEAVNQPTDPDEMMGVDYSKLVPLLLKEIQSLRARVAQLEERK
jgi:hypothetical protein